MAEAFHYPPEILSLLVDTIPLLCRSKKDVILFFRGAGVAQNDLGEVERLVSINKSSITKYEIARNILTKVNARGDSALGTRREIIKRIVEFESFETCWEADQYKAKGLVTTIREAVDKKDTFTRIKQERDVEREERMAKLSTQRSIATKKLEDIDAINYRLSALFGLDEKPHERGKLLESILNDLFKVYGILVREDFRRRDPDTSIVVEQIDGVIELNGQIYLVEMKWLNAPVGIGEFSPHLSRLFLRQNANGIFISANGYASSVESVCKEALSQKTIFLCSLREIVMLLQRQDDLLDFLNKKSNAAIIDKNPFLEILS